MSEVQQLILMLAGILLCFGLLYFFSDSKKRTRRVHWGPNSYQEGLATQSVNSSLEIKQYAVISEGRVIYPLAGLSVFLDTVGSNIIELDFMTKQNKYAVKITTRDGKSFTFYTYDKNIPAVMSTFFSDGNANKKGTYSPFIMRTSFVSTSLDYKIMYVPYQSSSSSQNMTFMAIWSMTNNANELLKTVVTIANPADKWSTQIFTLESSGVPSLTDQRASATANGGDSTLTSPNNGLAFLFGPMAPTNYSSMVSNWAALTSEKSGQVSHYYAMNETVSTTGAKTYTKMTVPTLVKITPFVYYNPNNGDVVVLTGNLYTAARTASGAAGTTFTAATVVHLNDTLQTDSATSSVIKTSEARRYRRPTSEDNLVDVRSSATVYDVFKSGVNDNVKRIETDAASKTDVNTLGTVVVHNYDSRFSVCTSPLEKKLIYYFAYAQVSVLAVVLYDSVSMQIDVESVRVFDNVTEQQMSGVQQTAKVGSTDLSKYQSKEANTEPDSSSDATDSKKTSDSSAAAAAVSSSPGALSDLERRAIYDSISALFFSGNSYLTATGYTTNNCPATEVVGGQVVSRPAAAPAPATAAAAPAAPVVTAPAAAPATATTEDKLKEWKLLSDQAAVSSSAAGAAAAEAKAKQKENQLVAARAEAKDQDMTIAKETSMAASVPKRSVPATPINDLLRRSVNPNFKIPMGLTMDFSTFNTHAT